MTQHADHIDLDQELKSFCSRYDNTITAQVPEDLYLLASLIRSAEQEAAGKFTTAEALLLCEALMKAVLPPRPAEGLPHLIRSTVYQSLVQGNLDEKWGVEAGELQSKVADLSLGESLAVWHWVKLFWTNPDWDHGKVAELFHTK